MSNRPTLSDIQSRLKANKSLSERNPHLAAGATAANLASESTPSAPGGVSGPQIPPKRNVRRKKRREMNRTEHEFSLWLQSQVAIGNLLSFSFEGMTLRWGDSFGPLVYTPDFTATESAALLGENNYPHIRFVFFEVKGAHCWRQDLVKFKAARAAFPRFEFQLHEKTKDGWQQTI